MSDLLSGLSNIGRKKCRHEVISVYGGLTPNGGSCEMERLGIKSLISYLNCTSSDRIIVIDRLSFYGSI